MFHEKNAMGGGSPFVTGSLHRADAGRAATRTSTWPRATERVDAAHPQELVGEAHCSAWRAAPSRLGSPRACAPA